MVDGARSHDSLRVGDAGHPERPASAITSAHLTDISGPYFLLSPFFG